MARVLVVSDDGATVVPIVQVGEAGDYTEGPCPCGEVISDRGHFEDTVEAVKVHVDNEH
jgi:hypothetical protein